MPEIVYTQVAEYPAADDFTTKHTPLITAQRDGEKVVVTVEVGRDVPHPNELGHYITTIELYWNMAPIARLDLLPTVAAPKLTVECTLPENTKLMALEHCNLHGVWAYEAVV